MTNGSFEAAVMLPHWKVVTEYVGRLIFNYVNPLATIAKSIDYEYSDYYKALNY